MSADWHYVKNGQQAGPVELETLRQMLAGGSLSAATLVYGPGLAQWTAAGQVPALAGAGGAAIAPTGAGNAAMLGYRGVETEATGLSPAAIEALRQTKPWVRFIGIMAFIGAGFMVLGGLSMVLLGAVSRAGGMGARGTVFPAWLGLIYLVLAPLYIIPGVLLNRYASGIASLMQTRRSSDVERALTAQKSFWKFIGIMMIVFMCLYPVLIVVIIAAKGQF